MTPEDKQEIQRKIQPVAMTSFEFLIVSGQFLLMHWQVTGAVSWSWGWVMLPTIIFVSLVGVGIVATVLSGNIKES